MCHEADLFTIGRVPVRVTSDSTRLLGPIENVLRPCADAGGRDPFHLRLRYGSEPAEGREESLRLFWSGLLRGGIPSEYYAAAGCRVARVPGRAWGRLDFEARTMKIVCRPGQEGCVYDGCLTPLLCELLAHLGHFVIHAASLATEQRDGKVGILMAGVSGAGKTTTSLALAHAGMTLLADDMSFIESPVPGSDRVRLWGLQLTCKVHDNTRRLLPWLSNCPAGPARVEGETCVDVANVVGDSAGLVADPCLLLLLGPRTGGNHVLMPLDKTQAMATLTRENIRAYEHRADGSAGNAFRALGQLVAQCRTYRLCVGEPLSTLGDRIRGLLEGPA
ncbi:MAG: hypothetical protein ABFE01_08575 [Phycisphaerales bacterium]